MKEKTIVLWLQNNLFHLLTIMLSGFAVLFYFSHLVSSYNSVGPIFMIVSSMILIAPIAFSVFRMISGRNDVLFYASGSEMLFKLVIFMAFAFLYWCVFSVFFMVVTF